MKPLRWRTRAARGLLALGLMCGACTVAADEAKVVRIIVPAPPGGSLDATARTLAQRLAAQTGDPHVVENKPGGNLTIATEYVVRSPPDGRVMLYGVTGNVISALTQKLPFSARDDLRPVVHVMASHFYLTVPSSSPMASPQDLVAAAARQPQGLTCAAPPGNMLLACEQLRASTGGKVTIVPYLGIGPAVTALLGGHVDFMFIAAETADPLVKAGRLRALAASSAAAAAAGGSLPLLQQAWPGFVLDGFYGLFVPAATPTDKVREINREVNLALRESLGAKAREFGLEPVGGTPEQFGDAVASTFQRYGELVRRLNLGPK